TPQEQILTADYESCWGYLPGDCWGRETSIKVVGGFAKSIPDMKSTLRKSLSRAISSVCPIRARAFGSWPLTFKPFETVRSLGRTIWETGSVPCGSCATSSGLLLALRHVVAGGDSGRVIEEAAVKRA